MEIETTLTYIGGSWYARIPPAFVEHLSISDKDKDKGSLPGMIKDETGNKGKYASIWKKGT